MTKYAYFLTYKGDVSFFKQLLDTLNVRVLAFCIVKNPLHAHAVIMCKSKLDMNVVNECAKHGYYLNVKYLKHRDDVDDAINYVVKNPDLHKSDGDVYSVRFIKHNGDLSMGGGGVSEDRLDKLEREVSELKQMFKQLMNELKQNKTQTQRNDVNKSDGEITLDLNKMKLTFRKGKKQGRVLMYISFANYVREINKQRMIALSADEIDAIIKVLNQAKQLVKSRFEVVKGFDKAVKR